MGHTQTLHGSALQVYINGKIFGIATGIRWQENQGRKAIMGIDQYTPFELAPGPSSINGTIECMRTHQDGGLEGRGVSAPESKRLLEKYFSLAVVDRVTDTVILAIENAAISNQSWQVSAKGLLTGSFMFEGMGWAGELGE